MDKRYFGADGIRGKANKELTPELALKVGQAAGLFFAHGEGTNRVVIGKDTRLSGYMIENALVAGLTSTGKHPLLLGPIPINGVSMLTRSMRADIGVMITASQDSFEDNGIALFDSNGNELSRDMEIAIEELINSDLAWRLAVPMEIGRAKRIEDAQARYIELVKSMLSREVNFNGLRVVLDCANGAAYKVVPETLWEMGAEVISIGCDPDGLNINHQCGSAFPAVLRKKVKEVRADVGFAFAGDADRIVMCDETGHLINGEMSGGLITALQALAFLKKEGRRASEVLRAFSPAA